MTVKLFQDVAGTIPAVLPGQPVGFIKRTKGSDDAKQATALSKPTYARHPKGGVRNLATAAQSPETSVFWRNTISTQGLTATKIGWGVEDGQPYVDYHLTGTSTGVSFASLSQSNISNIAAQALAMSVIVRRLSGDIVDGGASGFRMQASRLAADGSVISTAPVSEMTQSDTDVRIDYYPTMGGAASEGVALAFIFQLRFSAGVTVDQVYRIKRAVVEVGPQLTPFQFNYGPHNITEPSVPDLWHLYNDGGDSLNVTLPAGTYGLATIGIDRQIVIGTFVSDGATPVNILRHERQLDVSYRLGAYSFAEELAIRDAWGRKYA